MELTFLGTGTSMGIPVIGCQCETCTSDDPKDKRLRTSALLKTGDKSILIDCGPDFRQQMLREGSPDIDAILLTHTHYDHVAGIDDLRPYCLHHHEDMPVYCREDVARDLRTRLNYCFRPNPYPGVPKLDLHIIKEWYPFNIGTVKVEPVAVDHGKMHILGFRIGKLGYITDASYLPGKTIEDMHGVEVLVINALRHESHLSHFNLKEALEAIEKIKPTKAFLVHLCDQMGPHAAVGPLPDNVFVAYDGLKIRF